MIAVNCRIFFVSEGVVSNGFHILVRKYDSTTPKILTCLDFVFCIRFAGKRYSRNENIEKIRKCTPLIAILVQVVKK